MSPRQSDARQKMLESAVALIRERGAANTSIDQILNHSGAPRGSVYHHFPDGRQQVIREAITSLRYGVHEMTQAVAGQGLLAAFDLFLVLWQQRLTESDFSAGCPVVAVTIESDAELIDTAQQVFGSWRSALIDVATQQGVPPRRAASLATMIVASVEGAVILCRAERSIQPLKDVGRELRPIIESATAT